MMATIIERWQQCRAPLPPDTEWIEDKDGEGCRLDLRHEGKHLIEVRSAANMSDRFTYRARFGGL